MASVAEARAAVQEREIALLVDRGGDFYTLPAATQGVCLQVFDHDWHAVPPPAPYDNPMRTAEAWDEHPIGLRGIHHLGFACTDLDDAERFWCDLTGGAVTYRAERPAVAGRAVGLDIGIAVELVAPTGPGAITDFLDRYGPRIWSTTFRVRDLDRAGAWFASKGAALVAGDAPTTRMLPPERNLSFVYQFTE